MVLVATRQQRALTYAGPYIMRALIMETEVQHSLDTSFLHATM
jgi:hypothetical protein